MDAMALLCNMHADGPATIKLLRRAGYTTLADIARAKHERLADLLGVSPPYARRFVREARLLAERTGEIALDREESSDRDSTPSSASGAAASDLEAIAPAVESASQCSPDSFARAPVQRDELDATLSRDRAVLARRISATPFVAPIRSMQSEERERSFERRDPSFRERDRSFRERDRSIDERDRSSGSGRDIERNGAAAADTARVSERVRTAPASSAARVLPAAGTPLRAGSIEGLDAAWCDRLVAQGILTLETLVDAPGLKLAKRLGTPLTELMNLQMLAQRAIERDPRTASEGADAADSSPNAERDYVLVPTRAQRRRADELDAAHGEDSDAHGFAASTSAPSDRVDDVGGPFA
jgi:hypothetical protein